MAQKYRKNSWENFEPGKSKPKAEIWLGIFWAGWTNEPKFGPEFFGLFLA